MAIVIVLAFIAPRTILNVAGASAVVFRWLSRRPAAAMFAIASTNLLLTFSLAMSAGLPKPYIHDEFAYALEGDTFAHGRLTNPTHPMWQHFESYHIFHQPSYQAKYPPAQGMVLAAGQVVSGEQIAGVWISLAIACCSVYWMLLGWTRPRWALLGGLLAAIHPSFAVQWGESYWGGAVAMLGGALVYGALPRLKSKARLRDAFILAIGLAVLANSRPYEGLVVSFPVIPILAVWFLKDRARWPLSQVTRVAVPVILVLSTTAAAMGYYNFRVTGSPWRLPYQHWMKLYATGLGMSEMLWRVDDGRQGEAPTFELGSLPQGATTRDLVHVHTTSFVSKLVRHHLFFFRIPLTLTLLAAPVMLFRRHVRLAAAVYFLVWLAVMANHCSGHGHYYAPATALLLLIVVECLRSLRCWRIGRLQCGRVLALAIPLIVFGSSLRQFAVANPHFIPTGAEWVNAREQIEQELAERGGRHLVLVSYEPGHNSNIEWVYNGADLDDAPVLWARPISSTASQELADWYKDRTVWRLNADANPPQLVPHAVGNDSQPDEVLTPVTNTTVTEVTSFLKTGETP